MSKKIRHVVKRKGHTEPYDQRKVYASVYAAALSCHYGEQKSEQLALSVIKKIDAWIMKRASVTSDSIRDQVLSNIKDKDVKLMYKHHLDVS